MAQIRETNTVVNDIPVERRTVVEDDYSSPVVYERRGMSSGAIAGLVIAGIIAAIVITLLIVNSQQRNSDMQVQAERDRADAAQRAALQAQQQQPPPVTTQQPPQQVVVVPPSQPSTVTVPAPSQPATTPSTSSASTSSVGSEVDVTTKLLDDSDLRSHPIDVKVDNGIATLSGDLPSEELKARAEHIAMSVNGIRRVRNNIKVTGGD